MRILFFSPYFYPYTSGLTILPLQILKHWSGSHQITVLTFPHQPALPQTENKFGLTIHRLPFNFRLSKGYISYPSLTDYRRYLADTDLVITNLPNFEGWPLVKFAHHASIPVLAIYHCQVYLEGGFHIKIANAALNWAVNFQLKRATTILGTSSDYLEHTPQIKPFLSKSQAIYPPIQVPSISNAAVTEFKKLKQDRLWVGFIGRIAREKGVEYLIKAIAVSPLKNKLELVIAGPKISNVVGESNYHHYILDLINQTKIHHRVLGFLPTNKLGAFYKSLDVLVLPSVNSTEAFGQVQVEAMLSGTPVIASNLPGVRVPINETGMGLIVSPKNSREISSAFETILQHRSQYTTPIQKKLAHDAFNDAKTYRVYDEIIGQF